MKIWIILKEIHLTGCIVSCFKEYEVQCVLCQDDPSHFTGKCGISRRWLDSINIAQGWLGLATIKCHWNVQICFMGRGGQKTSQYLVWPPFASHLLPTALIRLLIVACGMLVHSSSMAVQSCYWQELEHAVVYISYICRIQLEMKVVDEQHNNGPQDLVTASLCIQNSINAYPPIKCTCVCCP